MYKCGERELKQPALTSYSSLKALNVSNHITMWSCQRKYFFESMHPILSFCLYLVGVSLSPILKSFLTERKNKNKSIGEGNPVPSYLISDFLPPPLNKSSDCFFHVFFRGVTCMIRTGYKTFIGGCTIKIFLLGVYSILSARSVCNIYSMSPYKKYIYLFGEVVIPYNG